MNRYKITGYKGNKVKAIKDFRTLTKSDLKTAKDAIEQADGHEFEHPDDLVKHAPLDGGWGFEFEVLRMDSDVPDELRDTLESAAVLALKSKHYKIAAGVTILLEKFL